MEQTAIIAPCDGSDRAANVHIVAALRILSSLLRGTQETWVDLTDPAFLLASPKEDEDAGIVFTGPCLPSGETMVHAFIRSLVGSYRPHERNVLRMVLIRRKDLTPAAFADAFEHVLGPSAVDVSRPIAQRIAAKAIQNFRDAEALPLSSPTDVRDLIKRKMKKKGGKRRLRTAA